MENGSSLVELIPQPIMPTAQDAHDKSVAQWQETRWARPLLWTILILWFLIWLLDNVLVARRDWGHFNAMTFLHFASGTMQLGFGAVLGLSKAVRRPKPISQKALTGHWPQWYKPRGWCEYTFGFSDVSLNRTDAYESVNLRWPEVKKIVAAPTGLLFYYGMLRIHSFWLPQRIFSGLEMREKILRLAREHRIPVQMLGMG